MINVIHPASLATDAEHPEPVTVNDPLPPPAATDAEAGDSEYVQAVEPVIVKGCR